jgi:hypothetical protein
MGNQLQQPFAPGQNTNNGLGWGVNPAPTSDGSPTVGDSCGAPCLEIWRNIEALQQAQDVLRQRCPKPAAAVATKPAAAVVVGETTAPPAKI